MTGWKRQSRLLLMYLKYDELKKKTAINQFRSDGSTFILQRSNFHLTWGEFSEVSLQLTWGEFSGVSLHLTWGEFSGVSLHLTSCSVNILFTHEIHGTAAPIFAIILNGLRMLLPPRNIFY